MTLAIFAAACAAFLAALRTSGVISLARAEISGLRRTIGIARCAEMDEAQKEAALQRAALLSLRGFVQLISRAVFVAAATALPVLAGDLAGVSDASAVAAFSVRPEVIAVTLALPVAAMVAWRRLNWSGGQAG